ncbi:YdhK family protein [Mesobacillus foraminis]|uniref:YdhK family protein n=1 Tax=Mesobacillus foraminis TaxID=279826 RepID=UPI001BEA9334|nr:YdhK family protein [Mesobacillus foraminis]MBT2756839.1 YdhK family protein [Mesobacillus foraminis]
MRRKKWLMGIATIIAALTFSACSGAGNDHNGHNSADNAGTEEQTNSENTASEESMDHSEMNHSGSAEVPEGLKEAENPTFPVGSKAIIQDAHMEGMKGAEATISGAFDTTVYTVTYTPTTGGEKVEDHKWVIHEELKDAGDEPLEPGDEATLEANHMEGMKGANAVIDSAEQTTAYMIDFTPTTGGEEVKNHKWVTESELTPAK